MVVFLNSSINVAFLSSPVRGENLKVSFLLDKREKGGSKAMIDLRDIL